MRTPSARPMLLGLACICITGCVRVGQQQEQPWRLVTLSPLSEPEAEQAAARSSPELAGLAIGVGPVHLPGYLDQDQLVTRITQHRITLSENDRWAEPLDDNMAHAVAHDLSLLLQADGITVHTWPGQQQPAYQVEIDVLSFETDTAGTAHLAARWLLREVTSRETIAERETRLIASGAGSSTEQSVASLSKALGEFSVRLADAVGELVHSHRTQSPVGAGN
ncbi:MAG TPA: PqiC family protein [Gemmatimonadales bacterium]|nr:PqiC family protein [Gemmatimonadales bacterium]